MRAPWRRAPWLRVHSRRTLPTPPWPLRTGLPVHRDPTAARSRWPPRTSVSHRASGRSGPGPAPPGARCCLPLWDSFSLTPPTVRVRRRYPSGRRRNMGSRATERIPASALPHDARSATHRRGDSGGADCVPYWHTPGSGRDSARGPSRSGRPLPRARPGAQRRRRHRGHHVLVSDPERARRQPDSRRRQDRVDSADAERLGRRRDAE